MRLISLTPARNEAWCLAYSLRAALTWVDHAVVLDHGSNDRTPAILAEIAAEHPGRVTVLHEPEPVWREMEHRHRMLLEARYLDASHLALIDADEILSANMREPVRAAARQLGPGQILAAPLHNLWRSLDVYRCDGTPYGNGWASLVVRDDPSLRWEGDRFHHRHPAGSSPGTRHPHDRMGGGVMHMQHASWQRLRAKQALYKMTEVLRWPGREPRSRVDQRYSAALAEDRARLDVVPGTWWAYPFSRFLIDIDAEPWQEAECRKLWREHGAERFAGLDLFGVVP